ncbi:MAG: AraC family transcriptional regulator [Oscillospiraceae bacterium]|nr:AraC family transcriptional regulator [Oscillospiraceae bacterium]
MPSINYPVIGEEQNLPYYVCGIGIEFEQNDIFRREGFKYPQFVIFTKGEGEMLLEGKKIALKQNSAIYLPANVPHTYYSIGGEWQSWWINFSGRDIDMLLETLGFTEPTIIGNTADYERLLRILRKIYNTMKNDNLYGNYYASGFLYEFMLEMYKHSRKIPSFYDDGPNGFIKAVDYMGKNYAERITMEKLCRVSDLSEAHLCRLFKKHYGMRPMEYLNKTRIQHAKELLTQSHISVENAAVSVGFETPSYFGRLFRRYEGCSPSEYKKYYLSDIL